MYLGAVFVPIAARTRIPAKPFFGSGKAPAAPGRVEFAPGAKYPMWNACGGIPGSGSPCNYFARMRMQELRAQGKTFAQAEAIMKAEGSFLHYAGM